MSKLLVVGSLGYDSISTPKGKRENILGGSANYFSTAASLFAPVNLVGVVGEDYKQEHLDYLSDKGVDIQGLQKQPGKTFHWEGAYEGDMNEAQTLKTELNVFENFNPVIPNAYQKSDYVFLANIDPILQLEVMGQVDNPKFVALDTMNYWIDSKIEDLKVVLKKVDALLINDGEAKTLTGIENNIAAARQLSEFGPKTVIIKRGEYGFVLFHEGQYFVSPAFPIEDVVDPTGAGDTFAAGFFGSLAKGNTEVNFENLKQACVHGALMASFTVQGFGLEKLKDVSWNDFENRLDQFKTYTSF